MNIRQRVAVIALNRPSIQDDKDVLLIADLESKHGLKYQEAYRFYKGTNENSYMILVPEDSTLNEVRKLARDYNQESILIIDEDRKARLEFTQTGSTVQLGTWTEISALEARERENWTLIGGSYYAAK